MVARLGYTFSLVLPGEQRRRLGEEAWNWGWCKCARSLPRTRPGAWARSGGESERGQAAAAVEAVEAAAAAGRVAGGGGGVFSCFHFGRLLVMPLGPANFHCARDERRRRALRKGRAHTHTHTHTHTERALANHGQHTHTKRRPTHSLCTKRA